jgi:2-polyprenyl-3-methyl-5-hydroxy-6-metoxy-1,4-benzoquinol methylase
MATETKHQPTQAPVPAYQREADRKRLRFIIEQARLSAPAKGRVLDVGCGNGVISINLGAQGYQVQGIDASDKAIENARRQNPFDNVRFDVISAEQLQADGQSYDIIICSEVLEHLHQPASLVKLLYQLLAKDGILIVTVPNGMGPREVLVTKPVQRARAKDNWLWKMVKGTKKGMGYQGFTVQSGADDLEHIQFFSKSDLTKLANDNGFQIIRFGSSNFVEDVFPISWFANRIHFLQKVDCAVADVLPHQLTGGFFSVWKKKAN